MIAGAISQSEDKQAAKRPEVFRDLFSEEYPNYADEMTFVKAEQFLSAWDKVQKSFHFTYNYRNFMGNDFKDEVKRQEGSEYAIEQCGSSISSDFSSYALSNPVETYRRLEAIISSTDTKVKGEA